MSPTSRMAARRLRAASMRWIYPRAPWLHDAVFFQLRRRLSRLRQRLREGGPSPDLHLWPASLSPAARDPAEASPLVSVIVPCYNHAPFLEERLRSITSQTYRHWELILLDDASSDGSQAWLETFVNAHPELPIRWQANTQNSGSPFRQWQRGLELARGELVWIAESDDSCEANFLEELVPLFANQAVLLAFARTRFCSADGSRSVWELADYLPELGEGLWKHPWVAATHQLVQRIWCRRNLIPNVSGALFRRPHDLAPLSRLADQGLRVCGDWLFYLQIARAGLVAYTPHTCNHYRQHQANTSVSLQQQQRFFDEHLAVCRQVNSWFALGVQARSALAQEMETRWQRITAAPMPASLRRSLEQALGADPARPPTVMVATYALVAGGGELAPLRLANLLHAQGFSVSVLNAAQLSTEAGIRQQLHSDIPLFTLERLPQLLPLLRDLGIEVLHSHHSWLDATAADLLRPAAATPEGQPALVVTSHGLYDTLAPEQLATLSRTLVPQVSQFTVVAHKNRHALIRMGVAEAAISVIPNAIETQPFTPIPRQQLGLPPGAFVACLVSRAIPEKGWDVAIEAIRLLRERTGADAHLLLVGQGPEHQRLSRLPQQESWLHLLGFQANSRAYFATADVGLLPSGFAGESSPYTLLECLAAGRPYVASDLGEIRAMLTTPEGLAGQVLPLHGHQADAEAFAAALERYIENPTLLERHRNRAALALQQVSPERIAAAYAQVYRAAVKTSANPTY